MDILYIFRIRKMHLCDSLKINHSLQLYQHTNKIHLHRSHYTFHNISSLSLVYLNLLRHRRLYDAINKSCLIYIYLWEKACTVSSGTQILYKDVRCESVTWWYPGNFSVRTVREEWGLKWNAGMWTGGRFLHYWGMEKFVFAIRTDGTVLQMSAGKILTPLDFDGFTKHYFLLMDSELFGYRPSERLMRWVLLML